MPSIRFSPKHGVNPSLLLCPICSKETNGIALLGRLKGDIEAPRYIFDKVPCKECQEKLDKGYRFLIEVFDGESGANPRRTGRIATIVNPEALPKIANPVSFIEQSVMEELEKRIEK